MRRSSWIQRPAVPFAVAAVAALIAAGVAGPGAPGASAADGQVTPTASSSPTTTKPKTTKPKTTKPKTTKPKTTTPGTDGCLPGCMLVVNDFETDSQGWTRGDGSPLGVTTADPASGKQALAASPVTSGYGPTLTISAETLAKAKGQRVVVTLSVRASTPVRRKPLTLMIEGADDAVASSVAPTRTWKPLRGAFVPNGHAVTITVVEGLGDPCRPVPKILLSAGVDDVTVGVPVKPVKVRPVPTPSNTRCGGTKTPRPTPAPTTATTATTATPTGPTPAPH